jgi:hypothetical protein
MKKIYVNVSKQTVTVNNQTCSFEEAGLYDINTYRAIIVRDEIEHYLREKEQEINADYFNQIRAIVGQDEISEPEEKEEVEIIFEDEEPQTLSETLMLILSSYNSVEPNIKMWVDSEAIFAVFEMEDGEEKFLYMTDHRGIEDYIDEDHEEVEINYAPEGVGSQGLFWMNQDFESPFHVSDFEKQIRTVKQ